jgi:hypothetical protein
MAPIHSSACNKDPQHGTPANDKSIPAPASIGPACLLPCANLATGWKDKKYEKSFLAISICLLGKFNLGMF